MVQIAKGTLIPIGGNECRKDSQEILSRIIKESGKSNPKICLFTLAADKPLQLEDSYINAFKELKVNNLQIINFSSHTDADTEENLLKVKEADIILFSNGSQLKLTSLLGGTHLMARIKKRYYNEDNFVVAGISAGASAMSNTMIGSCRSDNAMLKGELELINGLDLIHSVFIDTHYAEQGRFGCLIQTVTFNPAVLGIGLGEKTAVVIKNNQIEVIGKGLILIVDGTSIEYTDLTEITHGEAITVEGIKMHFLSVGKKYNISKKKIQKESSPDFILEKRA